MAIKLSIAAPSWQRLTYFFAASCLTFVIADCSRRPSNQALVSGSDGFEVPRAELDQARSAEAANGMQEPQSILLQRLVSQKLFAHAAHREKLDRDLSVVQAIEAARRQILAGAYVERLEKAVSPPSEAKIADFYAVTPELYAARKVITFDEISYSGDPAQIQKLKAQFSGSGGALAPLQATLQRGGYAASIVHVQRAPEDLAVAVASQFSRLKPGDSVIYQSSKDTHFAVVRSSELSPLSLVQAEPKIRQLLLSQARRELIDKDAARLQAAANLTYAKGYASPAPTGK